jgi:hypothetical protein
MADTKWGFCAYMAAEQKLIFKIACMHMFYAKISKWHCLDSVKFPMIESSP